MRNPTLIGKFDDFVSILSTYFRMNVKFSLNCFPRTLEGTFNWIGKIMKRKTLTNPRVGGFLIFPAVCVYVFLPTSLTRNFHSPHKHWKMEKPIIWCATFQTQFSIFTHSVFRCEIVKMFLENSLKIWRNKFIKM